VPIAEWDRNSTIDLTDPTLAHVTAELRRHHNPKEECLYVNECAPQLIVAIESLPMGWQNLHYCGLQVVQSTFGATPGHPALLDAISTIVQNAQNISSELSASELDDKVFEYTGPCLWANSVWRYLHARWGFDFRLLDGAMTMKPVRVGDVLIFPYEAFGAWFSGYKEEPQDQWAEMRVWHGAHGRWRNQARPG